MSILNLSAEDVAKLSCEDGVECAVTITGTVTLNPDGGATIESETVEVAEYEEGEVEEEVETEATGDTGKPMHKNPAIAIVLAGGMGKPKK